MPETQSEWTEEDRVAAEAFLRRLETGGRKAPLNTLVALVFSLLIFCQGLYWMSTVKQAVEPGPTVLERLDAVPSDPSVPDILRVSGQSRKGLLLVQAEAQVRRPKSTYSFV